MTSTLLTGVRLSPSEIKFITEGVEQSIRKDGRGLFDARSFQLDVSLLPHANGSARVRTAFSTTDVLCSVKFELGTIDDPTVNCSIDLSVLARADLFGQVEASKRAERRATELVDFLTRWLDDTIELPKLINKVKWLAFVDCVVFGDGGNLQDAISLGCYCALRDARIPETIVNEEDTDFDVNPDFGSATRLSFSSFSLTSTIWLVSGQLLVDPTSEEEVCAHCAICINFDRSGNVRSVVKTAGGGTFPSSKLPQAMTLARTFTRHLLKCVDTELDAKFLLENDQFGIFVASERVCLSKVMN